MNHKTNLGIRAVLHTARKCRYALCRDLLSDDKNGHGRSVPECTRKILPDKNTRPALYIFPRSHRNHERSGSLLWFLSDGEKGRRSPCPFPWRTSFLSPRHQSRVLQRFSYLSENSFHLKVSNHSLLSMSKASKGQGIFLRKYRK